MLLLIFLLLVGITVGYTAYRIVHPSPWAGKLAGWKLDKAILRSKPPYLPRPSHVGRRWQRPVGHSYCLRCGRQPYRGPVIWYSKNPDGNGKAGMQTICWGCSSKVNRDQFIHYAKLIVDVWICQNFDDAIRQGDLRDIDYYKSLWPDVVAAAMEVELNG